MERAVTRQYIIVAIVGLIIVTSLGRGGFSPAIALAITISSGWRWRSGHDSILLMAGASAEARERLRPVGLMGLQNLRAGGI
jgi:hypothetical protein